MLNDLTQIQRLFLFGGRLRKEYDMLGEMGGGVPNQTFRRSDSNLKSKHIIDHKTDLFLTGQTYVLQSLTRSNLFSSLVINLLVYLVGVEQYFN